ncbi:hypothetical protein AYI92_06465 [Shewanella xiamenensis]|uniref:hypothetical protein n=1 Tax=Shewanella xiamenensis TaxID=332186 RepID=UPI0011857258|nr:hypothetical protein [Shewanella xiamenensis]TVL21135.1 hypothetical protein AYI90_06845 [Shewanella xiamenensis]TVL21372.1 hypothetical protein AYI91_08025 [Shewanella xiamenensis]TVL27343.1 hypothetical protein AYI92_06465 [Shewanella xiamenensis]TVL34890.1 hypothetical protein AYI93_07080 [Shewanella xiamenensis]TVP03536.1 hypothetical protein AYI89_07065 [Shewanella xiamenensis]
MRKPRDSVILLLLVGSVFSLPVRAGIEDMTRNLQKLYMWEKIASTCKTKSPTELKQEWTVIEMTVYAEASLWEGNISAVLRSVGRTEPQITPVFESLKWSADVLARGVLDSMSCHTDDKDRAVRFMVSDPAFKDASEQVLDAFQ